MGAWLSEAAAWLAQPNGAGWVTLPASLSAFGLPVSQGRLSGLEEPGTSPCAHACPPPPTAFRPGPRPGDARPGRPLGTPVWPAGQGMGLAQGGDGWGEASPPNQVPKRRGCLRPTQGPRWEGAALGLAEPRCLVGGAALGPSGLSARAAPGTPASWHRGGVGTERPSPLGRTSGPEPRALRFGPGSSPVPRTRVGQGGEQAAAWAPRAPVGSPPPHAPAAASRRHPCLMGPEGWLERPRLPGAPRLARTGSAQVGGRGPTHTGVQRQVGAGGGVALGGPRGQGECGIWRWPTLEGESVAVRGIAHPGRERSRRGFDTRLGPGRHVPVGCEALLESVPADVGTRPWKEKGGERQGRG